MKQWTTVAGKLTPADCFSAVQTRYTAERAQYQQTAAYLLAHHPETAQAILAQADAFMLGQMVLCGTGGKPFFVGNPPRWSDNAVGDPEYVFMLNRMNHWPILVEAYTLSGDVKYAQKVLDELSNWIDTCPPLAITREYAVAKERFAAVTPWRSLELGVRPTRSWNIVLQQLCTLPIFTVSLFEKMALCLHDHADILYQVCPVIWPKADHNHYLTECLGLFEISCICDFFALAPTWRTHAMREIERCAATQILPGGGQIEGAPTYHNECLYQMTYSIGLAKRYGYAFSTQYETLVHSMFLHSFYTTRPDGNSVPWGDSDATPQVFLAAFAHYEAFHEDIPLRACAAAFDRTLLSDAFLEHIWKLPEAAALDIALHTDTFALDTIPYPTFCHNVALKQVMMRSEWQQNADSVFFSARSPIHNDHAHIDPNGFDFHSHGCPILSDSGRYTYREGADRYYFKSGASHNTLLINHQDAFAYQGTWAYGPQKYGAILSAAQEDTFCFAAGMHENYAPVTHNRVIGMQPEALFVFDFLTGACAADCSELYFQLNTTNAVLTRAGVSFTVSPKNLCVSMGYTDNLAANLIAGRTSPTNDFAYDIQRLCLCADGTQDAFLTVICVRDGVPCVIENVSIQKSVQTFSLHFTLDGHDFAYRVDAKTGQVSAL